MYLLHEKKKLKGYFSTLLHSFLREPTLSNTYDGNCIVQQEVCQLNLKKQQFAYYYYTITTQYPSVFNPFCEDTSATCHFNNQINIIIINQKPYYSYILATYIYAVTNVYIILHYVTLHYKHTYQISKSKSKF